MKNNFLEKRGGEWDYTHDAIIDRIGDLTINCPECENIDDEQYQCGTCGCGGGQGTINVLQWVKEQAVNVK